MPLMISEMNRFPFTSQGCLNNLFAFQYSDYRNHIKCAFNSYFNGKTKWVSHKEQRIKIGKYRYDAQNRYIFLQNPTFPKYTSSLISGMIRTARPPENYLCTTGIILSLPAAWLFYNHSHNTSANNRTLARMVSPLLLLVGCCVSEVLYSDNC